MSKKLIVALFCLAVILISLMTKWENNSLDSAGERLISAMYESSGAVAVFNMDKGVFV